MNRRLSPIALLLGLGGLIPFMLCGVLALRDNDVRGAQALAAYGAVILAFLGAVHWGFALPEPSGKAERARLALGVVPALVAWVALLAGIALRVEAALTILLLGFLATTIVEARANRAGLMPAGYMALRWGLSAVVVLVLVVTLIARIAGIHIALGGLVN